MISGLKCGSSPYICQVYITELSKELQKKSMTADRTEDSELFI